MKNICLPSLPKFEPSPLDWKRTFITNSFLYERLIQLPRYGYFFYKTYPKLAADSLSIAIGRECKSVVDELDSSLDQSFEIAAVAGKKPIDWWASHIALGGKAEVLFLTIASNEKVDFKKARINPVTVFLKLRKFYEEKRVNTFRLPFSDEELVRLAKQIDEKVGKPLIKELHYRLFLEGSEPPVGGATCVRDLVHTKLFSSYGYAYTPSYGLQLLPFYSKAFLAIEEELRKNVRLSEAFKAFSAEESMRYLLGPRVGALNELVGFRPLDILGLVSSDTPDEQVEEAVLKVRKDCKKIRQLFEEVHTNCLRKKMDKAMDAKMELADADRLINYSILDNISEFMGNKLRDAVHEYIDGKIEEGRKRVAVKIHRYINKHGKKLGWISELKFLTFGTILILTSCGIDASYLRGVFQALGTASLVSGAVGVASRIFEEGMKISPGFNIYVGFIKWPKIA